MRRETQGCQDIRLLHHPEKLPFAALHDNFPFRFAELAVGVGEAYSIDFHGTLLDESANFPL
jgi:hypothetical protein